MKICHVCGKRIWFWQRQENQIDQETSTPGWVLVHQACADQQRSELLESITKELDE